MSEDQVQDATAVSSETPSQPEAANQTPSQEVESTEKPQGPRRDPTRVITVLVSHTTKTGVEVEAGDHWFIRKGTHNHRIAKMLPGGKAGDTFLVESNKVNLESVRNLEGANAGTSSTEPAPSEASEASPPEVSSTDTPAT